MKTKLVPGKGRIPYPAYRGKEPYIFISYAHVDSDLVFEEIRRFNEAGYHVWYDEGIAPGNEWTDEIAQALSGCALFVIMVTPRSAGRINVQNEVNYALDEEKPFLAIHLEPTELRGGMKLRMNSKQAILKYNMTEEEYAWKVTEAFTRMGLKPDGGSNDDDGHGGRGWTPPPPPPPPPPPRKKWLIPVIIAALLIAGIALYALGPWRGAKDQEVVNIETGGPTEPAVTEAPEEAPEEAETPVPTEEPAATEAPEETAEPEATEAPAEDEAAAVIAVDPAADVEGLKEGDIVSFGHYEQDNGDNGTEAIEWIVLDVDDDSAVLLSRYALDCKPFNEQDVAVTWESSTLRQWLNGEFLGEAFTQEEQARIRRTEVTAEKNPNYSFSEAGGDTRDKVWLLSAKEAVRYFPADAQRACYATQAALARGAQADEENGQAVKWWWLRTPGFSDDKAIDVFSDGTLRYGGDLVYLSSPVRPAITLKLHAGEEEPEPEETPKPTQTPEPTEEPTPEPTEEPTPEPTEEPAATGYDMASISAEGILPAVEETAPVMEVTLFDGEKIVGPLSSVQTYFTNDAFSAFSLTGVTYLSQTRDEEAGICHFETDDPFSGGIDWDLSYTLSDSTYSDEQDQSFSIDTSEGTRLISLFAVKEIVVTDEQTIAVAKGEAYERDESGYDGFNPSGTVRVYLKDGTVYTSFPEAFKKFATANTYMDRNRHPDYAQTRDFWIEEASQLVFSDASSETNEDFGYLCVTGTLADGEPVGKFMHVNGTGTRILTLEKGIVRLNEYDVERIEVDMSQAPDFSKVRTGRITLTDGTVYELPVTAMEYNHYEGGGFVRPHPVYDYFFLVGGAEFDSSSGYAEEERELAFGTLKQIEFINDNADELGDREFPAIVTYRDGTTEELNFRFYNYYGNYLEFYYPDRQSIDLDRYDFSLAKIEFG